MSRVMAILAEYSAVGVSVSTAICVGIYLLISIKIVRFCRRENVNVAVMGMIPVLNLIFLVRGISAKYRRVRAKNEIESNV